MKVKLKEGLSAIGNANFELVPGIVSEINSNLFNSNLMVSVEPKIEVKKPVEAKPVIEERVVKKQSVEDFKKELVALKGIGPKIADQILNLAKSKEDLVKIDRKLLIKKLRDDVVVILDKYLRS